MLLGSLPIESCRSSALAAIKGDSPLGKTNQAIVIANRGEGAAPAGFEQVIDG